MQARFLITLLFLCATGCAPVKEIAPKCSFADGPWIVDANGETIVQPASHEVQCDEFDGPIKGVEIDAEPNSLWGWALLANGVSLDGISFDEIPQDVRLKAPALQVSKPGNQWKTGLVIDPSNLLKLPH